MDQVDYSGCCQHGRRVMVDWEDKGVLQLLDMDHIMCGCGQYPEIIDIRNCQGCPEAVIEGDLDMTDEEAETWFRWSFLGGLGIAEPNSEEQYGLEGSEE